MLYDLEIYIYHISVAFLLRFQNCVLFITLENDHSRVYVYAAKSLFTHREWKISFQQTEAKIFFFSWIYKKMYASLWQLLPTKFRNYKCSHLPSPIGTSKMLFCSNFDRPPGIWCCMKFQIQLFLLTVCAIILCGIYAGVSNMYMKYPRYHGNTAR